MELINSVIEFFKSEMIAVWAVFILMVVEYWLGKTNLVKPGSTIEVILNGLKTIASIFKKKE
jgi:hypothetical protein